MKGRGKSQLRSPQALAPSCRGTKLGHGLLCPLAPVNPHKVNKSQVGVTALGMLNALRAN